MQSSCFVRRCSKRLTIHEQLIAFPLPQDQIILKVSGSEQHEGQGLISKSTPVVIAVDDGKAVEL